MSIDCKININHCVRYVYIQGHPAEEKFFMERSKSYKNIFNNETGFMQARYEDGAWSSRANTWTEADQWVYTFNVQHDFPGLRDLFAGPRRLGEHLDAYYEGRALRF
jgi:putative alpha-1,2-mannosidase